MKIAVLLLALQGPPATVPAANSADAGRWTVDGSAQYCSLFRTRGGPDEFAFAVQNVPGSPVVELSLPRLPNVRSRLRSTGPTTIELQPGGARFETSWIMTPPGLITFRALQPNFLDRFVEAREIRIIQGGDVRETLAFPDPARAMAAMRHCIELGEQRWGLDSAQLSQLQRWPEGLENWTSYEDYPRSARVRNIAGQAVVRLSLSAEGRITRCTVLASSGNEALDQASCLHPERGRFNPALDREGRPVAVDIAAPVAWWMQD